MFLDRRQIRVVSTLGDGFFQLRRLTGHEQLSEPFELNLELRSEERNLDPGIVLGTFMAVELETRTGKRLFGGYVSRFEWRGGAGRYAGYSATLVPWLWFLRLRKTSRIFSGETVPAIVAAVIKDAAFPAPDPVLSGQHEAREYTVQHQLTDLDFVSHLLAEEGIYYYFETGGTRGSEQTMVLMDSSALHKPVAGYGSLTLFPQEARQRPEDSVWGWRATRNVRPGGVAVTDFDWTYRNTALAVSHYDALRVEQDHHELFEYPTGHTIKSDGARDYTVSNVSKAIAELRLQEAQTDYELFTAETDARGLAVGHTFKVANMEEYAVDKNATSDTEYIVLATHYSIESDALESDGEGGDEMVFRCSFTCMDQQRQYRPPRRGGRPPMYGPQTAIVTGRKGDEIHMDPDSRVLVQFHWDRDADNRAAEGKNTSCYLRVAQGWGGAGFGMFQIPRVGEEVIVDFLDGDPDRPLIIGRLYNGKNKAPYADPSHAGIKTHSTPGGAADNFNELRFEDGKGKELVYLQAEKDQKVHVKNDQTINVDKNRSLTVGATQTIHVAKKDTETYDDVRDTHVKKKVTETYDDEHERTVTKKQTFNLTADKEETITGTYSLKTDKAYKLKQGGSEMVFEGNAVSLKAAKTFKLERGSASLEIDEAGKVTLKAPAGIVLECGASTLTLTASGIQIAAPGISAAASASKLDINPGAAIISSSMIQISAQGIVTIAAPAGIKLNS